MQLLQHIAPFTQQLYLQSHCCLQANVSECATAVLLFSLTEGAFSQGMTQLLQHLTALVQQGNLVEQLEDVVDDKITNEVKDLIFLYLHPL